jgi:hypothetical protein
MDAATAMLFRCYLMLISSAITTIQITNAERGKHSSILSIQYLWSDFFEKFQTVDGKSFA